MTERVTQSWQLVPHDPLVFGTGRRPPATLPRMSHPLPLPGTLAGAMRSRFVGGANDLSPAEARRLLNDVQLRGPWLQRDEEVWVRAPSHVRAHDRGASSGVSGGDDESERAIIYPELERPGPNEGVLTPEDTPLIGLLTWRQPPGAHKSTALDEFVSLDVACGLLLEECERLGPAQKLLEFEGRLHVTINAAYQTAEPSALYSSPGVRYDKGVSIGVETTSSRGAPARLEGPCVLGGESRVVAQRGGAGLPDFANYRERYEKARARCPNDSPGLLLMLATPASFSARGGESGPGWVPPWLLRPKQVPRLEGVSFELAAVATTRFVPMSSWSLASRAGNRVLGRQRAVRRLVPAGTVYYLRVEGGADAWLRACEHFWWRPIDEGTPGDPEELVAPPHRDGYGLVIPGLFWPDRAEGES